MTNDDQRLSIQGVDPTAYAGVLGLEHYARGGDSDSGGLEQSLRDLVKIRASQINGCAWCLDMHHREAREHGEAQRRLDVLSGWHEARSLYSEREQAALALTEEVTLIADGGVPDEVWETAAKHFTERELVRLLMVIAAINVWNRLAVSTRQDLPELE